MLEKSTIKRLCNYKVKHLFVLLCLIFGTTVLNSQTTIECLYPFIPTDCSPCIDPSENMVNVTTDCAAGYTLTIGDPVLVAGAGNCPGSTYSVTYTATDNCGFSASCSQTWVIENEGPQIECPMDLYLDCGDPNNDIYIDYWLSSVTSTSDCPILNQNSFNTYNPNWINGPCPSGFQTVTFFVTDECGRTSTCSSTVFVLDHEEPVLTRPAEDLLAVCSYNTEQDFADWLNTQGGAVAEDQCSNVSWSTIPANPQLPLACNEIEVTFVATDGCGWQVSTTATFELIDCHPPIITEEPMDMIVECVDDVNAALNDWLSSNGGAMATDACGTNITWMTDPMNPELSDDCGNTGSVTVVFIAKDDCGNAAMTETATFTVEDNTPPVFTSVPDDATVECMDDINLGDAEAEDACGSATVMHEDKLTNQIEGGFNGAQEVPPSGSNGSGTAIGTYEPVSGKFSIEVNFSGLTGNTVMAHIHNAPEGANGPVIFPLPIPTDVTEGSFSFMTVLDATQAAELEAGNYYVNIHTTEVASGEIRAQLFVKSCIGNIMRIYTATDECGNTATAMTVVSFEDTEAPVPSEMPADITISCDEDVVFADDPTWTDNCDTDIFTSVEDLTESDPDFCIIYVRAWSAIDDCGNLGTTKQRIFVEDNEPPVFTYVPPVPDIDCMVPPFDFEEPIAEDNCGEVTLTFVDEAPNGSICDEGAAYVRAYTATDECGNTATVDVVIWVNADAGPPEFTFVPEDLTFYCIDGDPQIPDAVAVDDCDPDVVITFEDEFNTDPDDCGNGYGYDIIRTWTATDHCGNQTTAVTLAWVKGPLSTLPPDFGNNGKFDKDNDLEAQYDLFELNPNPVTSNLNVIFNAPVEQQAIIKVYDILGKEIMKRSENVAAGMNTTQMDVSKLLPGTYLISLESNDQRMTRKFIKR